MGNRRKVSSIVFTGVAAAGAVGLGTGTANAASGPFHITNGGAGYAGPVSGVNSTSATLTAHGTKLTCVPGTASASGSVPASTVSGTPAKLGTITGANFGTGPACSYAGLFHFTATLNKPVSLIGSSYASGVTKGKIAGGISATLNGVSGTTCTATITGPSLSASYHNDTHALTINPSGTSGLKVTSISAGGCGGLLALSEPAAFTATYQFNPPLSVTQS